MARMPDGFVFITNVSGPKVKDGQAYADVGVEERELVMCKNCKWWDKDQTTDGINGFCPNTGCCEEPDFYCADGERRQEHGEAGEHMEGAASASI